MTCSAYSPPRFSSHSCDVFIGRSSARDKTNERKVAIKKITDAFEVLITAFNAAQ